MKPNFPAPILIIHDPCIGLNLAIAHMVAKQDIIPIAICAPDLHKPFTPVFDPLDIIHLKPPEPLQDLAPVSACNHGWYRQFEKKDNRKYLK